MREVDPDNLTGEQEFEMKAAFGADAVENGDIVHLEKEDLAEPTETYYPMARQLEVGDHVVVGSKRHDRVVTAGTIEEMNSYSMTLDVDEDVENGSSYLGFSSFGGDKGSMKTVESVNGEEADVEYGEVEA